MIKLFKCQCEMQCSEKKSETKLANNAAPSPVIMTSPGPLIIIQTAGVTPGTPKAQSEGSCTTSTT